MTGLGIETGPGITRTRPDRTELGMGLGRPLRYPDRVFSILPLPGPDLIYPDRTGCTYIWNIFLNIYEKVTWLAYTFVTHSSLY